MQEEDATGRFHASLALSRQAYVQCGGWPLTMRGDFDQQLLARLVAIELPADPCTVSGAGYVFRWGSTGAYHGQALMRGPRTRSGTKQSVQLPHPGIRCRFCLNSMRKPEKFISCDD